MAVRLYRSPDDNGKTDKEGKNREWENTTKLEGTARITATAAIKRDTKGEREVDEKKTGPREMPNRAMAKWLRYNDKQEK